MPKVNEADWVIAQLARRMYIKYCQTRGFVPNEEPYVPAWALDYARIAVGYLSYDEEAVEALGTEAA